MCKTARKQGGVPQAVNLTDRENFVFSSAVAVRPLASCLAQGGARTSAKPRPSASERRTSSTCLRTREGGPSAIDWTPSFGRLGRSFDRPRPRPLAGYEHSVTRRSPATMVSVTRHHPPSTVVEERVASELSKLLRKLVPPTELDHSALWSCSETRAISTGGQGLATSRLTTFPPGRTGLWWGRSRRSLDRKRGKS